MKLYIIPLLLFLLSGLLSTAQQLPADLSNLKATQISDAQIKQLLSQAKANGLTLDEVEMELSRRKLPSSEIQELKRRMQEIELYSPAETADSSKQSAPKLTRTVNQKNKPLDNLFEKEENIQLFGTELFSGSNLSFEPDLRMATPTNYIIGPDDDLILTIYGVNVTQQTLKVTPEGNVNVKYAGLINLSGLSVEAAASLLKSRLIKYYPALSSGQTKLQLALGNIRSIKVIIIGAIKRPGTYTLPSLATLFNALYVSGGPGNNGSFRNIELIRNNKVFLTADLYEFLVDGNLRSNIRLQDNDVIRIPFATTLVTLKGQLNRPGIFEIMPDEHLDQAIKYAGGFKSKAYKGRIRGSRILDFGQSVLDIAGDSLAQFPLRNGDEFQIDSVINRYNNRVTVTGAVFRPGAYALEPGLTVHGLIEKALGVKEDVFDGRAVLIRTRPNLTKEYINVELGKLLRSMEKGIELKKDDSLHVASLFDLRDTVTVSINGAVRKPGIFRFEDSLTLKTLILKAGGYSDYATGKGIEISRRKRDISINTPGSKIVELISVDDNKDLSGSSLDLILQPFDIITIKENPYYRKQISVKISGEVLMPAVYTLQSREERLSSIIARSGGLLYTANIKGAKLIRKKKELVDSLEIKRLLSAVKRDTSKLAVDSMSLLKDTRDVAIDLSYILKHPGSLDDIFLEEGDELIIPRINNTVSVNGEVFKPLDIMYEKNKSLRDYLSDAGGVTLMGKRTRTFVIYPNGSSAKIKRTLGIFPRYPSIQPGSNIYVPQKPKREGGFDTAKAGILVSAITALITAVALFTR
ncbi:SLBB domain-containing protein [Flavihumibacter sp. CACIAM 22H1]|uniref:SLBB domain-containing protein n=1 Tax=Flavihumibacter sp. CACIAM 22H1 TaxID=1812911 RepID=UPI000AA64B46|nr:SLBB domain-containing protein [Flavihumibacter sp. CACIAM 22H1]